jgi:RimJ/RimL family protein N-acetyltransferase
VTPKPALPYEFTDPIRTERLTVRAMTLADIDDVYLYQSREDVCRYVPFEPRTLEEVTAKVAGFSTELTLEADGDYWQLAIVRSDEPGRVIGDVFFRLKSIADATGEIGWSLHPDFSGQGYMTEAASAILDLAFGTLKLHRVMAVLDPRNGPSKALCGRLGMRREAYFVEDGWFKGEWGDTEIHAILAREWNARRR